MPSPILIALMLGVAGAPLLVLAYYLIIGWIDRHSSWYKEEQESSDND